MVSSLTVRFSSVGEGSVSAMARTRYYTATTLDGFLADPDHSLQWLFTVDTGEAMGRIYDTFMSEIGAMVLGASTYLWMREHEMPDAEKWREWYADRPAFVVTHRDLPLVEDVDLRRREGDVRAIHAEALEAAGGKDVWVVGGGDLVGQFADAGLLDEIIAGVAPVTLGSGAPLLPRRIESDRLTLTDVRRSGQFAMLTYAVGPPPGA